MAHKRIAKLKVDEVIDRLERLVNHGGVTKDKKTGQYIASSINAFHLTDHLVSLGRGELVKPLVDPNEAARFRERQRDMQIMQGVKSVLKKPEPPRTQKHQRPQARHR